MSEVVERVLPCPPQLALQGAVRVYRPGLGGAIVATRDLKPGHIVLRNKPYAFVLNREFDRVRCSHCFKQPGRVQRCAACSSQWYCGRTCQREAWTAYHKHECAGLKVLGRASLEHEQWQDAVLVARTIRIALELSAGGSASVDAAGAAASGASSQNAVCDSRRDPARAADSVEPLTILSSWRDVWSMESHDEEADASRDCATMPTPPAEAVGGKSVMTTSRAADGGGARNVPLHDRAERQLQCAGRQRIAAALVEANLLPDCSAEELLQRLYPWHARDGGELGANGAAAGAGRGNGGEDAERASPKERDDAAASGDAGATSETRAEARDVGQGTMQPVSSPMSRYQTPPPPPAALLYLASSRPSPPSPLPASLLVPPLLARFQSNNFAASDQLFTALGAVLCPAGALLNHSCWPACVVVYDEHTHTQEVRCVRAVCRGEEITHAYVDVLPGIKERRRGLRQAYAFTCTCERCACVDAEHSEHSEVHSGSRAGRRTHSAAVGSRDCGPTTDGSDEGRDGTHEAGGVEPHGAGGSHTWESTEHVALPRAPTASTSLRRRWLDHEVIVCGYKGPSPDASASLAHDLEQAHALATSADSERDPARELQLRRLVLTLLDRHLHECNVQIVGALSALLRAALVAGELQGRGAHVELATLTCARLVRAYETLYFEHHPLVALQQYTLGDLIRKGASDGASRTRSGEKGSSGAEEQSSVVNGWGKGQARAAVAVLQRAYRSMAVVFGPDRAFVHELKVLIDEVKQGARV